MATPTEIANAGIILRVNRATPLTHAEMDTNFSKTASIALDMNVGMVELVNATIDEKMGLVAGENDTALTVLAESIREEMNIIATNLNTLSDDGRTLMNARSEELNLLAIALDKKMAELTELANNIIAELPLPPAPLETIGGNPIIRHVETECNIAPYIPSLGVRNLAQHYTIPSCNGLIEIDMNGVSFGKSILVQAESEFTAINSATGGPYSYSAYSIAGVDVIAGDNNEVFTMLDHSASTVSSEGAEIGDDPLVQTLTITGIPDGERATVIFVERLAY